jgi:hypothetical protein
MAVKRYGQLRRFIVRMERIAHDMHVLELDMAQGAEDADAAQRLRALRTLLDELRDELRDAAQNVT